MDLECWLRNSKRRCIKDRQVLIGKDDCLATVAIWMSCRVTYVKVTAIQPCPSVEKTNSGQGGDKDGW